jgi:hypothetical protein
MEADKADEGPFKGMNFLVFAGISFAFFLTFPFSLVFVMVVFGIQTTKALLLALLEELMQTLLVMVCGLIFMLWIVYQYLWPMLVGVFS